MSKVIGIDLGTTNSCVAVMEGGKPVVIANAEGIRTTPSVVAFTKTGERLIGETAKRQAVTNADRTILSIKRQMGTNYSVNIDGKQLSPQEISAMILQKLKKDAEDYLGTTISEAVITVPAYFNDAQRQATKDAGRIAGLDVKRIINEPTAAALSYGLDNNKSTTQKVMVYDLGGGTFDVSIIEISNGIVEVLATSGDNHLGGDDIDNAIADYLINTFKQKEGIDLSQDKLAMQRIKEAAEKAKKELSASLSTNINLPFIYTDNMGPKHMDINLSRVNFEKTIQDLVERTKIPVKNALNDAGLTFKDIDRIILVGGSTRIPIIQQTVKELAGYEPSKVLNPDECVALGAAIQGGNLSGETTSCTQLLLLDVTPLTLSIELSNGQSKPLIKRNSTIPISVKDTFTTSKDFQDSMLIKLYQGERLMAKDNFLVGTAVIDGILPAKAGLATVEINFQLDSDGIIKISAIDVATKKKTNAVIKSKSLSQFDIDKAMRNAAEFERNDALLKQKLDLLNEAEHLLYQTKENVSKYNFSEETKKDFNFQIEELQRLVDKNTEVDYEELKSQIEKFKDITGEYYTEFYSEINKTNDNPYTDEDSPYDADSGYDFYSKF